VQLLSWCGWAWRRGRWQLLVTAEDLGTCHRRLLQATLGWGLGSRDRALTLDKRSPASSSVGVAQLGPQSALQVHYET
jgi:hypothetical protein